MSELSYGKYRVVKKLGTGGMAEVFLVRLEGAAGFAKEYVLKRILSQYCASSNFVQMFIDEAIIASELEHPNLVKVQEFGTEGGAYFLVMEYVDGLDLSVVFQRLSTSGQLIERSPFLAIAEQLADGLGYVHQACTKSGLPLEVVHRDISPHNLMVSSQGSLKVMDFGIAKAAVRTTKTVCGTIKGKLSYIAPEQIRGEPASVWSDQFSAGLVLWELWTGHRYYGTGHSEFSLMETIRNFELRDPQALRPDTPDWISQFLMRMLSPDPSDRFEDMKEISKICRRARWDDDLNPQETVQAWFKASIGVVDSPTFKKGTEVLSKMVGLTESLLRDSGSDGVDSTPVGGSTTTQGFLGNETSRPANHGAVSQTESFEPSRESRRPTVRARFLGVGARFGLSFVLVMVGLFLFLGDWALDRSPVQNSEVSVRVSAPFTFPKVNWVLEEKTSSSGDGDEDVRAWGGTELKREEGGDPQQGRTRSTRLPEFQKTSVKRTVSRASQKAVKRSFGLLWVGSEPCWGRVYLDGKKVGVTPLARFPVSAGKHDLRIANEDCDMHYEWQFTARSGQEIKKFFRQ